MSVTFRANQPPTGWEINTWCDTQVDPRTDRDTATEAAATHDRGCTECTGQGGAYLWPIEQIEPVQMSNGNAADVIAALGYPEGELWGQAEAEDLAGRALLARAMLDESPGRPSETIRQEGAATLVHLGRQAGYVNRRIDQILTLAEEAAAAGVGVHWG